MSKFNVLMGLVIAFAALQSGSAHACMSNITEAKLFRVNLPNEDVIRAQTGDMIRIAILNPGDGKEAKIAFDETVLKLTTEVDFLDDTGRMADEGGKVYYLTVIGQGKSKISAGYDDYAQYSQVVEAIDPPKARGAKCR